MTKKKFAKESQTVLDFIQTFCDDKHADEMKAKESLDLVYENKKIESISYELCLTCKENFLYSYKKLQECPHEEKPRCRKCPNPCYEKDKWKAIATIMRYSGMKKGLSRIKKVFQRSKSDL